MDSDILGTFVNSNWRYGESLLHLAVQQNNVELVKQCIQLNVDVNKVDEQGRTALFYCRSLEIANILVNNGVDVNILDSIDNTAVVSLYRNADIDIIKYLAKITDLDLEGKKNDSSTLLQKMIDNQELDISLFEIVIPRTKCLNRIAGYFSDSYLTLAAQNRKYLDIIIILVEAGVDLYTRNRQGKNFYDLSFKYVKKEIEKKYPEFMRYKDMPEIPRQRLFKIKQLNRI